MSQEEGSGANPPTNVNTTLADDKRQVMLRLGSGEDAPYIVALDTTSVEALIAALGTARSQMLEPVPDDFTNCLSRHTTRVGGSDQTRGISSLRFRSAIQG